MQDHTLKALVVFRNFIYPELIRSVHVYQLEGEKEKVVEREYVFHSRGDYEEIGSSRVITLEKFRVSAQFKGLVNGVWLCIYVFDADRPLPPCQDDIPTLLLLRFINNVDVSLHITQLRQVGSSKPLTHHRSNTQADEDFI